MEKLHSFPIIKTLQHLFTPTDVNHKVVTIIEDAYERDYLEATRHVVRYVGSRSGGNVNIANAQIHTEAEQKIEREEIVNLIMSLP
jgi:hypothetical protein